MSIISLFTSVLSILGSIPAIGPYLAIAVQWAAAASGIITAVVALWQAVVAALKGLAAVPGLTSLATLANALSQDETAVDGFLNQYVFPVLSQLSVIPLPKVTSVARK
jgi:hypothetical protein